MSAMTYRRFQFPALSLVSLTDPVPLLMEDEKEKCPHGVEVAVSSKVGANTASAFLE